MTLPLTPDTLAAAYDYLCTTPPFHRWKLPESDDVVFRVSRVHKEFGHYQKHGDDHIISASAASIGYDLTLLTLMSHEMIHMYLRITNKESKHKGANVHNLWFRKYAARVCKIHGFDPKAFF